MHIHPIIGRNLSGKKRNHKRVEGFGEKYKYILSYKGMLELR